MSCLFLRATHKKKKVVVIPRKSRPKRPKRALTIREPNTGRLTHNASAENSQNGLE